MFKPVAVLFDLMVFGLVAVFKRIQFAFFPDLKAAELRSNVIMTDEREKFFNWDKRNLGTFLYTWKMLLVIFKS
jgi:hypothetical protein